MESKVVGCFCLRGSNVDPQKVLKFGLSKWPDISGI